jgi:hypothetical protein
MKNRDGYLNRVSTRWITYKAVTLCIKDWSIALGMGYQTLYKRLVILGWSIPKALTTEVRPMRKRGNIDGNA